MILLTDDEQGRAEACADHLADFGQDVVILRHRETGPYQAGTYIANLGDPAQVSELLEDVHDSLGTVSGIIHLLPFRALGETAPADRASLEVTSLYLLTRLLEEEIVASANQGSAFVLGATVLGGQLGFGTSRLDSLSRCGGGAISGFLKCLGEEWPDVVVRSIDFPDFAGAEEVVKCIGKELCDPEGPYEVGYLRDKRYTWEPVAAPLDPSAPDLSIEDGSVILVTGGARGITAEISRTWGERFPSSRLILLGRSPLPPEEEDASTSGISDKAELKRAIMDAIAEEGIKPSPSLVESRYRTIMTEREIRENMENIRATGASVEYHSVDVRHRDELEAIFEDIYSRHGKIDGVIHGAGVIDDKLLKDKTPESFDRVFSTKVESSFSIVEFLRPESLRFLSFFASIASRYGNRGQSDYAAANEVLCKLATELDKQWETRVFAVAWGPWSGIGMVSDLEKHLEARGIALIGKETGSRMFLEEVLHGKKGESEVIIAGGAENLIAPSTNRAKDAVPTH